jgi:protein-S-isoprenylcysteine O-methyltransferase Ste14
MVSLRIILFLGMAFHKLVWEYLKRSGGAPRPAVGRPFDLGLKSLVKLGKTLALLFLVIQTLFLDIFPISAHPGLLRTIGIVIYFIGLLVAVAGRLQLGKNWANLEDYQVLPDQSLICTGIYSYIRHPIYIGDVLLVLGLELALNSWLVVVAFAILVYVTRQALREEVILLKAFPDYDKYRKQTKMFIPYLF